MRVDTHSGVDAVTVLGRLLHAVRAKIARGLVEDYGLSLAEVARQVGISTSGVSRLLTP